MLALLVALAPAFAASPAASPIPSPLAPRADDDEAGENLLLLEDGRFLEGKPMSRVEGGIEVRFENGTVFVPAALVLDAVIDGDSSYVPTTEEEKAMLAEGKVPFEGKWVSPKRRQKLVERRVEERREELEEIKEHAVWRNRRIEKTKHFEFQSTVPPRVHEHFSDLMEAYFKNFAKQWRVRQPRDLGRLSVCFYSDRESFHQIAGVGGGVLGYFRYVEPLELNIYYDRVDPKTSEQVMFHEANHYLQKLLNLRFSMPHFPGESLAEYYGASEYDPETGKLETGLVLEGRLTEIQSNVAEGKLWKIEELILADGAYEHYTWGWSLVHFLMSSKEHQKDFMKFVVGLANDNGIRRDYGSIRNLSTVEPEHVLEAFRRYLDLEKDEDLREVEREWHAHVVDSLQIVSANGLVKAAMSAANQYPPRPLRAKRLFGEAVEAGTENPLAFHRYAQLVYADGDYGKALELWKKALEFDPLNGRFYHEIGKVYGKRGNEEEQKRWQALAHEIDPDDPYIDVEEIDFDGD